MRIASVGLRASGSRNLDEIACNLILFAERCMWISDIRMAGSEDNAVDKSYKYLPSLVNSFLP